MAVAALLAFSYLVFGLAISVVEPEEEASLQVNKELEAPQFSVSPGFYKEEFRLTLASPAPGGQIYYTTDGSTPTEESTLYEEPIRIRNRENDPNILSEIPTSPVWLSPLNRVFKGTLVKAIAVADKKQSKEKAGTFFVHEKGRQRYSLPVVSLIVEPDDLFGYRKGIYVMGATRDDKDFYLRNETNLTKVKWHRYPANYIRRGTDWERPVQITYFESGGNTGFSETAGIRINGNATRANTQKSLRLIFDESYGNASLQYDVFKKVPHLQPSAVLLKGFGQDQTRALFRDNLMQALIGEADVKVNKFAFKTVVLFINAEYWGVFSLQERPDAENIALKYQLPGDSITLLENKIQLSAGMPKEEEGYVKLREFIQSHDLSDIQNYTHVTEQLDVDNLIDYLIAEMYAANTDWPDTNFHFWRYKIQAISSGVSTLYRDGRWRWLLVDLDLGFGEGKYTANMVDHVLNSGTLGPLLKELLENADFRKKFFSRFEYHLNSTFETKRVLAKVDELEATFKPEMAEHIARWRTLDSYQDWEKQVEVLREFARKRPAYLRKELEKLKQLYKVE